MSGWTDIAGENQRFELYRVVVGKKEKEKKPRTEHVLFSVFRGVHFKFLSSKSAVLID